MSRFPLLLLMGMVALSGACTYGDLDPDGSTDSPGGGDGVAPGDDDADHDDAADAVVAPLDGYDDLGGDGGLPLTGEEQFLQADVEDPEEDPEEDPDPTDAENFFGFSPWEFGVVVIEDMGQPCAPYCSDFQGGAAVGGDVWVSGFSLNDLDAAPNDVALYAGGDVSFTGAVSHGGLEVAGDILLPGTSVAGSVTGGGDLDGSGTIGGDVTLAGTKIPGYPLTVGGTLTENAPFAPTVDLYVLGIYFRTVASVVSWKMPTLVATEQWGEIHVDAVQGMNVVEIDAQTLNDAWGIRITGPADASVYIDVLGTTASLDSLVWTYDGVLGPERTLLNYGAATELELSGGDHQVNILAPNALVRFPHGLVTGNLIAGELQGCGQVNLGGFEGDPWEDKTL